MNYLTTKDFNKVGIDCQFNLHVNDPVIELDNVLYYNSKKICFVFSQNAHDYFTINEDGQAILRRNLINSILDLIVAYCDEYNAQVKKILDNPALTPEEKEEAISKLVNKAGLAFKIIDEDAELSQLLTAGTWNHSFYTASIGLLTRLLESIRL